MKMFTAKTCCMTAQFKSAVDLTNIKVQGKILVRFPPCTPKIRVLDKRNDNVAYSAGRESCEFYEDTSGPSKLLPVTIKRSRLLTLIFKDSRNCDYDSLQAINPKRFLNSV